MLRAVKRCAEKIRVKLTSLKIIELDQTLLKQY